MKTLFRMVGLIIFSFSEVQAQEAILVKSDDYAPLRVLVVLRFSGPR